MSSFSGGIHPVVLIDDCLKCLCLLGEGSLTNLQKTLKSGTKNIKNRNKMKMEYHSIEQDTLENLQQP